MTETAEVGTGMFVVAVVGVEIFVAEKEIDFVGC